MSIVRSFWVAVALAGSAFGAGALAASGPARLLADLNQVPAWDRGSFPEDITPVGSYSIFRAWTRATGVELYRTDGTEAGTRLIKDLWPGPFDGVKYNGYYSDQSPLDPALLGDAAYFLGNDGVHGFELWRTDGTEAGTVMVKDILPGSPSGFEEGYSYYDDRTLVWKHFVVGGVLVFLADDGVHGLEMWRTDGTEAGTFMLKEIMPGSTGAFGQVFSRQLYGFSAALVGDLLYFSADDGLTGNELWKTDGTPDGTVRVRDINPGGPGSFPSQLVDLNGVLIFTAYEPRGGTEPWRSDGTFAGTTMVRDVIQGEFGSSPQRMMRVGDTIFFASYQYLYSTDGTYPGTVLLHTFRSGLVYLTGAFGYQAVVLADDSDSGTEMWLSNGTPAGTKLLRDIRPGSASSFPSSPVVVDGRMYFEADDGAHGIELWTSDGSEAGTHLVADLNPGSAGSDFGLLRRVGARCLFQRYAAGGRGMLMISDGTADGTTLLKDIDPSAVTEEPDGTLLLGADDHLHGDELWKTDGTPGGTVLVKDINPNLRTNSSGSSILAVLSVPDAATRVLFSADDGVHGSEPWVTDGTAAGTHLILDMVPGGYGTYLLDAITYHGTFYFVAYDDQYRAALWRTDGTEAGTVLVTDPDRNAPTAILSRLVEFKGLLYFAADDDVHGAELWHSDGTTEGTTFVADINPGPEGSYPDEMLPVGDTLYMDASVEGIGYELWKSDGTAAGTALVRDILPGPDSSYPVDLTALGDKVIMAAEGDLVGREYWVSDGTEAGTMLLRDIGPGYVSGVQTFTRPVRVGGSLYVLGFDNTHGTELWKTDGTPEGTVLVKDVVPGRNSGFLEALTPFKGALYFGVRGFPYDDQLWKSDGTEAGTVPVKVGFILGQPGITVVDDTLIFAGYDPEHGRELWRSDGTAAGTGLLQELNPGPDGSDPQQIIVAGDRVYFNADDGTSNDEPWVARAAILAGKPGIAVQDLIGEVRASGLPKGEETSLLGKLNTAAQAIDDGRPVNAVIALELFANEVDVLTPRRLSETAGADLRQFAAEITGLLGSAPRTRGPKPKQAAPRTTGRPAGVTVTPVPASRP